jgi:hypothetical protein
MMRRLGWFLNEHGMWQARPWLVWVLQRIFGLDVIPAVDVRINGLTLAETLATPGGRVNSLQVHEDFARAARERDLPIPDDDGGNRKPRGVRPRGKVRKEK